jgi:hypothetical protein
MMASRPAARAFAIAALLATSIVSAPVRAAGPSAADRETARALMEEGRDLREKKDLTGAADRFQRADAIMHVPTTGYELAVTQAALHLLVEARDTLARIRSTPGGANESRQFRDARKRAQELDDSLAGRVPGLTIVVNGAPAGVEPAVTIDDVPVPAAALGVPRRVNPGHHVIVAKTDAADGRQEADLAEGETKPVTLVLVATAHASPEPPSDTPTSSPSPGGGGSKTLTYGGIVVGGAGVAGIAVGAVTGVLTLSKKSSLQSECNASHQCPPSSFGTFDSANSMATISTVAFIAGGVCLAAGITGVLLGTRKGTSDESPKVSLSPFIGPGGAGVSGRF